MDTWNEVRSGTIKYNRCIIADRLWELLAPKALGYNPLLWRLTLDGDAQVMRNAY